MLFLDSYYVTNGRSATPYSSLFAGSLPVKLSIPTTIDALAETIHLITNIMYLKLRNLEILYKQKKKSNF